MSESRIAFVTGGGGGIGSAICRSLAKEGHRVAVADIDLEAAQRVAQEIGCSAVEFDVTSSESVAAAIAKVEGDLGPVDILVNCAGWDRLKPFVEHLQGNRTGDFRAFLSDRYGVVG